jgi:hypothetical protein
MLAHAYRYVRPGGYFVASFRLTPHESLNDRSRSYQYINFEGRREGEVAPYVVLNVNELMQYLAALAPQRIRAYGYWGTPSPTAVTSCARIAFAVFAVRKRESASGPTDITLDLPQDLLATLSAA